MKYIFFICFIILLFTHTAFSQNTGKVELKIIPPTSYLKINGDVIKVSEQKIVELDEGVYEVQIWHPKMVMVVDTIEVKANQTVNYRKILRKVSPDYREHLKKLRKYRVKKAKPYVLAGVTVGSGINGFYLLDQLKTIVERRHSEALMAATNYENAVGGIDTARANYEEKLADFNRGKSTYNTSLIVGVVGITALTGLTIMQFRKNRKNPNDKPIYRAENPFAHTKTRITPTLNYQNSNITMGFTLQF